MASGGSFLATRKSSWPVKLVGTAKSDTRAAEADEATRIFGFGGNDKLIGGNKSDLIKGGGGNDLIDGGAGHDKLRGQQGADTIKSGAGHDKALAGSGNDKVDGGSGNDLINGGAGHDTLLGGTGADKIIGAGGNDTLTGGAGDDWLIGGGGHDTAVFSGSVLDHLWWTDKTTGVFWIIDKRGNGGKDRLDSIEKLVFDDYTLDPAGTKPALVKTPAQSTTEDDRLSFDVDVFDPDGALVSIQGISVSGGGSVSVQPGFSWIHKGMAGGKRFTVDFDPGAAYQSLALGESVAETITLDVLDAQGNPSSHEVALTIHGANDTPVISGTTYASRVVTEDAILTTSGTVLASDIDQSDNLSYALQPTGTSTATGTYGTLRIDSSGQWTYDLANGSAAVQALASGQTEIDQFTVMVTDDHGARATTTLTINIDGQDEPRTPVLIDFEEHDFLGFAGRVNSSSGFGFDGHYVVETDKVTAPPLSGFGLGAALASGDNLLFPDKSPVRFFRDPSEDFELDSFTMSSFYWTTQTVTIRGLNDGVETGVQTETILPGEKRVVTLTDAGFGAVDEIIIESDAGGLGRLAFDDFLTFV